MSGGHSGRGIGLYTKELIGAIGKYSPGTELSFFKDIASVDKKADIIHYPFFDPFFLTMPWRSPKPTIVTIHDLIPLSYPDHFPRGIKGEIKWQVQKWAVKHVARAVITDSVASKREIETIVQFPKDAITAIPLAPREVFRPVKDEKTLARIRKQYALPEAFFLYVGDVNWNKNIQGLLHAYFQYKKTRKEYEKLILIGRAFWEKHLSEVKEIDRIIHQLDLSTDVRMPGFISDADLAGMYSLASACVFPSFAEGFGFPVLEAMACGCPVIAGDSPGLVEIAGPSVLVSPHNSSDIRKGLDMIRSLSVQKRDQIVTDGLVWTKKYTWQKVAVQTVKAYEKTLNHYSRI